MAIINIKTTQDPEDSKQMYIEGITSKSSFKYLCKVIMKSGVCLLSNFSVGIGHTAYASIDQSGSIKGMRKNYGWANDKIVKAHGSYFNIDRIRISHPLDALAYWIEQHPNEDLMNKDFQLTVDEDKFKVSIMFL